MHRNELGEAIRTFRVRLVPWLRFLAGRRAYHMLSEEELRATRRSETVFIFGSGSSLNDLGPADWENIAQYDTMGFNWWVHQQFVRTDYHLIRGIPDTDLDPRVWRPQLEEYFRLLRDNSRFGQTVFLIHSGFRAINGNRAIGYGYLPRSNPVFPWRTSMRIGHPSRSFDEGLVHGQSTIQECINAAYLVGWGRIVLVGVDLYDRRYFWLRPDETRSIDERRGATAVQQHVQAAMGIVQTLAEWHEWLRAEGVTLEVHNPRSLLAGALPVYSPATASA
jgi:hypothetical protein